MTSQIIEVAVSKGIYFVILDEEGSSYKVVNPSGSIVIKAVSYFDDVVEVSRDEITPHQIAAYEKHIKAQGERDLTELAAGTKALHTTLPELLTLIDDYIRTLKPVRIRVAGLTQTGSAQGKYIYLLEVDSDSVHQLSVGAHIEFRPYDSDKLARGSVVNTTTDSIFISTSSRLTSDDARGVLSVDQSKYWQNLKEQLHHSRDERNAFPELFERLVDTSNDEAIAESDSRAMSERLFSLPTPSAKVLWGPPGGGKTYCLAQLVSRILTGSQPERPILICATANRAVDAVLLELNRIPELKSLISDRKVIRYGHPTEEFSKLTEFFGSDNLQKLRQDLEQLHTEMKVSTAADRRAQLKAGIDETHRKLNAMSAFELENSSVVATTIYGALDPNSPVGQLKEFDTVIIDEISMVSTVATLGLLARGKNRALLAGDPLQLSPIFSSSATYSPATQKQITKWFGRNIYQTLQVCTDAGKVYSLEHSKLATITAQRRCADPIWQVVSELYPSIASNPNDKHLNGKDSFPFSQKAVVLIDTASSQFQQEKNIELLPSTFCEREGNSRKNHPHAEVVLSLLREVNGQNNGISIAVITPYKTQARLIQRRLDSDLPPEVRGTNRIAVGTVHAFQGSEADVVIFDLCEGFPDKGSGRLFEEAAGRRMMNVAITRARGKLYLICDLDWLKGAKIPSEFLRKQLPLVETLKVAPQVAAQERADLVQLLRATFGPDNFDERALGIYVTPDELLREKQPAKIAPLTGHNNKLLTVPHLYFPDSKRAIYLDGFANLEGSKVFSIHPDSRGVLQGTVQQTILRAIDVRKDPAVTWLRLLGKNRKRAA